MPWNFDDNTPIYQQIIEHIKLSIAVGEYKVGGKLLPVRVVAADAEVNPNTMQKALSELERDGLVYSQRTSGRFITDDEGKISALKHNIAKEHMDRYVSVMSKLGYSGEEAISELKKYIGGENK